MSDSKQYYNQCYWHADGTLVCKRVEFQNNPNYYQNYVQYDNFSKTNSNYKPNEYRQNLQYYSEPYKYNSGVDRNINEEEYNLSNEWLAPPRTNTRVNYFDN